MVMICIFFLNMSRREKNKTIIINNNVSYQRSLYACKQEKKGAKVKKKKKKKGQCMMCNERKIETATIQTRTKILVLLLNTSLIRIKNLTFFSYYYTERNERIYYNISRCQDYLYIHRVRLDFFLFSSIKIYVKTKHTSDDRKQRRACKASIVPSSFLSMTNNREKEE